jgi:hypothetical protein
MHSFPLKEHSSRKELLEEKKKSKIWSNQDAIYVTVDRSKIFIPESRVSRMRYIGWRQDRNSTYIQPISGTLFLTNEEKKKKLFMNAAPRSDKPNWIQLR